MAKLYYLCSSPEELRIICRSSNGKTLEEALELVVQLPEEHAESLLTLLGLMYDVDSIMIAKFYNVLLESL